VEFEKDAQGKTRMVEVPDSEFDLDVDLVLLAMGFTGPEKPGLLTDLGVGLEPRGNVAVNADYMTNVDGVFAAGDAKRGASLIVWAIAEGRKAAAGLERYLKAKVLAGR
jgi:glutamate synthase (NADPH/NADH) small chain